MSYLKYVPACPVCKSNHAVRQGRRDDLVWEWEFICTACDYMWEAQ